MKLKWHSLKIREDDYKAIKLNKSKYESKSGKTFKSMGEYLKEISGLLG